VANSYGGYVSLFLALRYPQLVRTLSLAEPPVHPLLRDLPGGEGMFQDFIRRAWEPAGRAFADEDMEEGVRFFIEGAVGEGEFDKLPPKVLQGMMKNAVEMKAATSTPFEMHMPLFTCEDARAVEAPTLLIRGEKSPRMYYLVNDELARCLPDVEQATIPGAAHVLTSFTVKTRKLTTRLC
jgi:pimeloyl-ACP methyl ester carboxylesterase